MNIEVTKDEVRILEGSDLPNENEYKITKCYFNFDEYTESFQVKRAIFTILSTGEMYETDIINNECDIPVEVLRKEYERVKIGVYGYNIGENEELLNRFSPSYDEFIVPTGSYEEGALSPEPITPSQYDLYSQALQQGLSEVDDKLDEVVETVDDKLQEVDDTVSQKISEMDQKIDETDEAITRAERLNIEASKSGKTTTITITKQDGTTESEDILDGEDGTDGENGIGLQYDWSGTSLGVKREDEALFTYVNLEGKKGDPGAINLLIVNELPLVGSEDTLYFVPKTDTEESDLYDEYVWINNDWELVGTKQITVDLSDYVKNTDYATNSVGGVIKTNSNAFSLNANNYPQADIRNYASYLTAGNNIFVGKGTLENVITGKDLTTKAYVDATIEANNIDVQINETSIVSDNVANISVTGSYSETDSPLVSLWDVTIDGSVPLGADENSININTTSGNYDGTSVLLVASDTLESEYVPIDAGVTVQGTNYSSSINNVGYQIEFGLTNNTSGDSNSIVLTPTETYIGNVKDPENDGDAVNKKYVDDAVISGSPTDVQINGTSIISNNVANILTEGAYGTRNKLLTKGYADTHYVLEEMIDDNVGYMYISPAIKDDKDVDFLINAQSNLDSEAYADMNFGVEYDENEGRGHGYFRLELYDAGAIEIDNNGTKITNVITPTNNGDAVNKKYVDDAVSDIDLSGKTDATKTLAGYTSQVRNNGTNIILSNVSTSDSAKNSGAMFASGNFSFFKNNVELISSNNDGKLRLYNVKNPENDGDAVNKLYVDNLVGDIETILTTLDVGGGV